MAFQFVIYLLESNFLTIKEKKVIDGTNTEEHQ